MDKNIDRDEKIKRMLKLMIESLMEGERTAFLGYEKYDNERKTKENSRNGYLPMSIQPNQWINLF